MFPKTLHSVTDCSAGRARGQRDRQPPRRARVCCLASSKARHLNEIHVQIQEISLEVNSSCAANDKSLNLDYCYKRNRLTRETGNFMSIEEKRIFTHFFHMQNLQILYVRTVFLIRIFYVVKDVWTSILVDISIQWAALFQIYPL